MDPGYLREASDSGMTVVVGGASAFDLHSEAGTDGRTAGNCTRQRGVRGE